MESLAYYARINAELGDAFYQALLRKLELIDHYPDAGRAAAGGFRILGITRFPFNIRYRVDETTIYVIAVSHQRRKPDYWQKRLEDQPE